jgi:hypothetical protein
MTNLEIMINKTSPDQDHQVFKPPTLAFITVLYTKALVSIPKTGFRIPSWYGHTE